MEDMTGESLQLVNWCFGRWAGVVGRNCDVALIAVCGVVVLKRRDAGRGEGEVHKVNAQTLNEGHWVTCAGSFHVN